MATIKFYPKIRDRKDTEVSIFAVFTRSRTERFQLSTDERILPRHWDFKSQSAKAGAPDSFNINRHLTEFKARLMSLYRDNRDKSFTEFKALAQGAVITDEKKSLFPALDRVSRWHLHRMERQNTMNRRSFFTRFSALAAILGVAKSLPAEPITVPLFGGHLTLPPPTTTGDIVAPTEFDHVGYGTFEMKETPEGWKPYAHPSHITVSEQLIKANS